MSVKSKHSSKKSSVGKREKKKKLGDSDEDIESSEEELDLTKECHPIGFYLNDRAEMINQMFSVIKGNKLKAMLPPILKECDIEQLKLQCLDQLLGMSEKRITCILEGETLDTSSESEISESEECESDEKNKTSSSSSDLTENSQDVCYSNNMDRKNKKRKADIGNEGRAGKFPKAECEPQEQGKTLLEILELEMRARAIRALLKQSTHEKGNDQIMEEPKEEINNIKEDSGEIVDLTECEDEELQGFTKKEKVEEEIDEKVFNFEKKIEKSKTDKSASQEDEKSKRLQAELELRNKLFKKKIYRTRQQRMENDEEEKIPEKNGSEDNNQSRCGEVLIKQEPTEPEEIVVEDPEEGEISTSEDEYSVRIKQEPIEEVKGNDFETEIEKNVVRVMSTDVGIIIKNSNIENKAAIEGEEEQKGNGGVFTEIQNQTNETENHVHPGEDETEITVKEASWRDRWLQKDGVQKLVKSSKIYAKVKKRIAEKSQRAKEEAPTPYEVNSDSNSNSKPEIIEGSIEEYEKLLSKNQVQKEDTSSKSKNYQHSASIELENGKAEKT